MNKEEFISSGLLELYALRISSPEETREVEESLERYPELRKELEEIEMSLENYAQANSITPSSSVKEKLFQQIFDQNFNTAKPERPVVDINKTKPVPLFYKYVAAAVFVLLIGSMILNYNFYKKLHNSDKQLQLAQAKLEQQDNKNKALSQDLDVITNKYAQAVVLNGTAKAPEAVAKIFWMKNTGQVYIDPTNLPDVPSGKQYQLWAIVDGKPVDAGVIQTSKGTYRIQKMKSFGKADAFAITLEKAGGSPTPTLDEMVVSAKM